MLFFGGGGDCVIKMFFRNRIVSVGKKVFFELRDCGGGVR